MRYSVGSGLDRLIGACTVACACSGAGSGRSARWRHSRVSSLRLELISTASTCNDAIAF